MKKKPTASHSNSGNVSFQLTECRSHDSPHWLPVSRVPAPSHCRHWCSFAWSVTWKGLGSCQSITLTIRGRGCIVFHTMLQQCRWSQRPINLNMLQSLWDSSLKLFNQGKMREKNNENYFFIFTGCMVEIREKDWTVSWLFLLIVSGNKPNETS